MDTRKKIIPLQAAGALLSNDAWVAVVGDFDPMTAAEAVRLAELGRNRKLLAVVLQVEDALLEVAARAALVAALRVVTAVTIASSDGWGAATEEGSGGNVVQDGAGDAARRTSFIELVLSKQQLR